MKRKKVIIAILLIFLLLLTLLWYFFDYGSYIDVRNVYVEKVIFEGNTIRIKGDTVASALAFSGHDYKFNGTELNIKLRYVLVNQLHKYGDFNIIIDKGNRIVEKVNIKGSNSGRIKQVWPK